MTLKRYCTMFIQSLQQFLSRTEQRLSSPRTLFWLSLSLTFSVIYSLLVLQQALDGNYIVQDDARKHIFWMGRFLNPELFPNDLIADFFQSVEPIGLIAIYRFFTLFNLDPMQVNYYLPLGLGIVLTYYCFGICFQLFPVPMAAFVAATLLNQSIWMKDIFVAAIASSFSYPLFFGFLYYLLVESSLGIMTFIVLEGLFYPPCVLLSAGMIIIKLLKWKTAKINTISHLRKGNFYLLGVVTSGILLLSYLLNSSEYGPIISKAEAITLPEFYPVGRASFFNDNPIEYWLLGIRSGMLPRGILTPVTLGLGLLFPILLKFPQQFPLIQKVRSSITFIPQLLIISISLFFAAHLLLFRLFLPNRYTSHSFYLIIAIMAGITITVLMDSLFKIIINSLPQPHKLSLISSFISLFIIIFLVITIIFYPSFLEKFTAPNYIQPQESELYDFLSQYPDYTHVASLSEAADNIPAFAKLPVLTAWEYAIPYQTGYYDQIRQRTLDLIQAQYSLNLQPMNDLIQQYQVDLILLDSQAFTPNYFQENNWLKQWQDLSIVHQIQENISPNKLPALTFYLKDCSVYSSEKFIVLDAACIQEKFYSIE
jgi:hypothetical protein